MHFIVIWTGSLRGCLTGYLFFLLFVPALGWAAHWDHHVVLLSKYARDKLYPFGGLKKYILRFAWDCCSHSPLAHVDCLVLWLELFFR